MTRIAALTLEQAPAGSRASLEGIQKGLGFIPNAFKTLAHAPAALSGYLALAQALGKSSLSGAEREVAALATSEVNGCEYCIAAHSFFAEKAGLSEEDIHQARSGKLSAIAALARQITESRGQLSDDQIAAAHEAGLADSKIVEVVAQVTLLTLTNYLNNLAATDIDFPPSAH
ncbi:Alkyl hydroperoxide reductase AhpD [compost metagenome]